MSTIFDLAAFKAEIGTVVFAEFSLHRWLSIIFLLSGTVIDSPSYRHHDTENSILREPSLVLAAADSPLLAIIVNLSQANVNAHVCAPRNARHRRASSVLGKSERKIVKYSGKLVCVKRSCAS